MKIIIAGSRHITDPALVAHAMKVSNAGANATAIISGCAKGVDTLGEQWAAAHNILVLRFRANWDEHGKQAGILRNIQMAEAAGGLVAIWDGVSKGTAHMIDAATSRHLTVFVLRVGGGQ